jgi:hypothetical protein
VVAWLLVAGCSYYDSSLLDPKGAAGGDGGFDGATDASDASDASDEQSDAASDAPVDQQSDGGCVHALPPDPPGTVDGGGSLSFVVAASSIDFGDQDGSSPQEIGYDLDMRCTCPEANGCMREAWAKEDGCDGLGGRDNMTGKFMAEVSVLYGGLGSKAWSEGLTKGDWSLLLRVRDYNGEANDDRVRVDWYIPAEFYRFQDGGKEPPKWDGTDEWPVRTGSLETPANGEPWDLDKTKYFDDRAYVTGGVLVGSVAAATIQVNEDYVLSITGGFLTAEVVEENGAWVLNNGIVAGRWPVQGILGQLSRIKDPVFQLPICTDNLVYDQIKSQICGFVDIFSGVGTPTTPCDAVSVGMRFETTPAQLGQLVEGTAPNTYCDPLVDPAFDSCENLF